MSNTENRADAVCRCLVNPWITGLLAMAELILGFVLLAFPFVLGASAVWVCGFVLCAAAVVRLVQGVLSSRNRWWNLLSALLYGAMGALMLWLPVASMEMVTLLIGIALMLAGGLRLLMSMLPPRRAGMAWRVFNACVSLLLGGLVVWGWPSSSLWFLGSVIAVEMIFSGWTLLFLTLAPEAEKGC